MSLPSFPKNFYTKLGRRKVSQFTGFHLNVGKPSDRSCFICIESAEESYGSKDSSESFRVSSKI